jgi:hypothetical protein
MTSPALDRPMGAAPRFLLSRLWTIMTDSSYTFSPRWNTFPAPISPCISLLVQRIKPSLFPQDAARVSSDSLLGGPCHQLVNFEAKVGHRSIEPPVLLRVLAPFRGSSTLRTDWSGNSQRRNPTGFHVELRFAVTLPIKGSAVFWVNICSKDTIGQLTRCFLVLHSSHAIDVVAVNQRPSSKSRQITH